MIKHGAIVPGETPPGDTTIRFVNGSSIKVGEASTADVIRGNTPPASPYDDVVSVAATRVDRPGR